MEVKSEQLFLPAHVKVIESKYVPKYPNITRDFQYTRNIIENSLDDYLTNVQMLADIFNIEKKPSILDVGCGVGREIIELAHLGAECIGLDADEDNVKFLKSLAKNHSLPIKADFGDGCNLPYKDETFDAILSKNFFEHVKDFDCALKEQIRVLKKNGRLIIMDGNILNYFTLFDLLIKYPIRRQGKYGGLRWLFTKGKVKENLYEVGGWTGKDEDVHSIFWWKKTLKHYPNLQVIELTTTGAYKRRKKACVEVLRPFLGSILVITEKK